MNSTDNFKPLHARRSYLLCCHQTCMKVLFLKVSNQTALSRFFTPVAFNNAFSFKKIFVANFYIQTRPSEFYTYKVPLALWRHTKLLKQISLQTLRGNNLAADLSLHCYTKNSERWAATVLWFPSWLHFALCKIVLQLSAVTVQNEAIFQAPAKMTSNICSFDEIEFRNASASVVDWERERHQHFVGAFHYLYIPHAAWLWWKIELLH